MIPTHTAGAAIPLIGTTWSLAALQDAPILPDSYINARFDADGVVTGTGGCNRYRASYQLDGSSLTIGAAAGTLMACPPPLMEQERAYFNALQATAAYELGVATLTLQDSVGVTLAEFVAEPQGLAGTAWEATGYNNGKQAVVSLLADSTITAQFGQDGTLAGNAGCNNYSGVCDVAAETIAVGPLRTTRKLCQQPEGLMEQERLYLAALQTAATYRAEGHTLELRTAEGALAVKFRRAADSPVMETDNEADAAAGAGQACVAGLVTLPEFTVLPGDAIFRVKINDISRMDAPAVTMGEKIINAPGATPVPYRVCYNPADIQPHHTYSMQVRIEDSSGTLLYISNTIVPVITRGAPSDGVNIAVVKVA